MIGNVAKIEELTEGNTVFRRVLYSGLKLQLVLMSVAAGEELGGEIHADRDPCRYGSVLLSVIKEIGTKAAQK
nr:hypothetical protein [uncultured Cohaesibacter sp.]